MRHNKTAVIVGLIGLLAFAAAARAAQDQAGAWTVTTETSGQIATMSYPDPQTKLGAVQTLEFDIGVNASAKQGHVTLKDGTKRDMPKEEAAFYYEQLDGPVAAWDYLASKDRVTKYNPAKAPLPSKLAGSFVRVIIQTGTNFFGKLTLDTTKPDGFVIAVDKASGGPIQIENKVVRELQVAK